MACCVSPLTGTCGVIYIKFYCNLVTSEADNTLPIDLDVQQPKFSGIVAMSGTPAWFQGSSRSRLNPLVQMAASTLRGTGNFQTFAMFQLPRRFTESIG
jgi:hypothetical protein